jgi:hypothetical protein
VTATERNKEIDQSAKFCPNKVIWKQFGNAERWTFRKSQRKRIPEGFWSKKASNF